MDKLKSLLAKRVAGIPVLVFVVLGLGVVLFYAWKMKPTTDTAPTDAAATDGTDANAPEGDGADTGQPVFTAKTAAAVETQGSVTTSGTPAATNDATFATNQDWSPIAVKWLMDNGASGDTAMRVISKYLAGGSLTQEEANYRDRAVKAVGLPPEPVGYSPISASDTTPRAYNGPATKQGTPPLTHTVKGTSDDTYAELARLYYGLSNVDSVNLIAAANTSDASGRGSHRAGSRITIPKYTQPKYFATRGEAATEYSVASVNGIPAARVVALNPNVKWPVKRGTRIRIA